jgi:aminodeoxychorismate lyase
MIVFLNGALVPEEAATISVFDRGFLYGDGLFETLRLYEGQPFRWDDHMARLQRGADFLRIRLPSTPVRLRASVDALVQKNEVRDAVLRITLSRGVGKRGYSPQSADSPTLAMALHPAPRLDSTKPFRWRLITASARIPANDPLTRHKTCNRLPNVLARAEAEAKGADDALLLNTSGEVAEAASANLFWIENGAIFTPPLESGALPGITRAVIFEICRSLSISCSEMRIRPDLLLEASGVFLTASGIEVAEAVSLDGHDLRRSPLTSRVYQALRSLISGATR